MCDFDLERENLRAKKKIKESEEQWESEPELEKIQQEEKPIEIAK